MKNGSQSVFRQPPSHVPRNKQAALIFTKAKPFHLPPVVEKIVCLGTLEERAEADRLRRKAALDQKLAWHSERKARLTKLRAERKEAARQAQSKADKLTAEILKKAGLGAPKPPEAPDVSKWLSRGKRIPSYILKQMRASGARL